MGSRCALLVLTGSLVGCLGARELRRNYYVLRPPQPHRQLNRAIQGTVRVRDMTPETAYDKVQLVIRMSDIQLRYSQSNLWAVRPHVMVSDHLAQSLAQHDLFLGVTRQLSERPDFVLSGDLRAIEVREFATQIRAHFSVDLRMTRFSDGEVLWSRSFDETRDVGTDSIPEAVHALSALVEEATEKAITDLARNADRFDPRPTRMSDRAEEGRAQDGR